MGNVSGLVGSGNRRLSLANREALADSLFSPVNGIGLNVVRYDIGGVTPGDVWAQSFRTGAAVPSFEQSPGSSDWSQDSGQRWRLQAQDLDANVLDVVVYSPPSWMTVGGCSAGANAPGAHNLAPPEYEAYASYLASIAQHCHDDWGLTLQKVAAFNGPDGDWTSTGNQESMSLAPSSQATLVKQIHDALVADGGGSYTQLSAPEPYDSNNAAGWPRGRGAAYDATAITTIAQVNTKETESQGRVAPKAVFPLAAGSESRCSPQS